MQAVLTTSTTDIGKVLRSHALLAGIVGVYTVVAFWMSYAAEASSFGDTLGLLVIRFLSLVPQIIFVALVWRLLSLTYIERSPDRFGDIKREITAFLKDRNRLLSGVLATFLMSLMLVSFTKLKNLIPALQPFSWDLYFVDLDRLLHFGNLPHEVLSGIVASPYAVGFLTGIYNIWLIMTYFVLVVACFMRPDNASRMRYLVAFVLTWAIGGNLLATIFSSAGPAYLQRLGLSDVYTPLMQQLQTHAATGSLTVIGTQDLLWHWQTSTPRLNAISAFPSMHVASSTLMAIFAFQWSRLAGIVLTIFAAGIMIGSFVLGWHYAVDGYAGAMIALGSWGVAGYLLRPRTTAASVAAL